MDAKRAALSIPSPSRPILFQSILITIIMVAQRTDQQPAAPTSQTLLAILDMKIVRVSSEARSAFTCISISII